MFPKCSLITSPRLTPSISTSTDTSSSSLNVSICQFQQRLTQKEDEISKFPRNEEDLWALYGHPVKAVETAVGGNTLFHRLFFVYLIDLIL